MIEERTLKPPELKLEKTIDFLPNLNVSLLTPAILVRRDAIFYKIFQRAPSLVFFLVNEPPPQAQRYRFDSVEVKEPTCRIDGVFLPPEDASPKVVFFAEVQFQKDESLYDRYKPIGFLTWFLSLWHYSC